MPRPHTHALLRNKLTPQLCACARLLCALTLAGCATISADPVVDVIIDSVPREAEVFMGKRRLGVTPLMMQMPSKSQQNGVKSFVVSKEGYISATVNVRARQNSMMYGNVIFFTTTSGAPSATTDFQSGYAHMFNKGAFVVEMRREPSKTPSTEQAPPVKRLRQEEQELKRQREEEAKREEERRKALTAAEEAKRRAEAEAERARLAAQQATDALERERLSRAEALEREATERARKEQEIKERAEREARAREAQERAAREAQERAEAEAKARVEAEAKARAEAEAKAHAEEERARLKAEQEALEAELERIRGAREKLSRARDELRLERERFEEERRLIEEERARQARSRGWRLRPLPRAPARPEPSAGEGPDAGAAGRVPEGAGAEEDVSARERRLLEQIKARQRALEELEERRDDRGVGRPGAGLPAFEVAPVRESQEEPGEGEAPGEPAGEPQGALPSILSPSWGALALSIEGFSHLTRALAEGDRAAVRAIYLRMTYARDELPEWSSYQRFMGCVGERRALLASAHDGLALYRALQALAFEPEVCQGEATARAPYAPRDPSALGARP